VLNTTWLDGRSKRLYALRRKYPGVYAIPALRSKTTERRYRLPDVCVLFSPPTTDDLIDAAFIGIEILSKAGSMTKVVEKLAEYEAKGVSHIWIIDPWLRLLSIYSVGNPTSVEVLQAADIELSKTEIITRI